MVVRTVFLLLLAAACVAAQAQAYPARPIRLISPYPPGGGNDTLARILADRLGSSVGQRIIVDNRPGAGTIVGTEITAKSAPDGHTVILLSTTLVTNPSLYRKLPYDTVKDLAPVALIALSPEILVAHPSVPATTVKQVIALDRSTPGRLSYASAGNGSPGHLAGALFNLLTGAQLVHVAYKGTAPAVTELLGGHVPLMMSSTLSTLPHVRTGKLRIIAITSARRSPAIPEAPTIAESGVPGYEATLWYGMLAPGGTPATIVNRLNVEIGKVLQQPDVIEKLNSQSVDVYYSTPEQFAARIREEIPKWAKVVAASGMRAE
ncbi:MAG TPA: tripartite tricarboxylate transporter substrate binding protein [Burkholderiales bacterium]|nr:tripartite tricarboxylate transporter substrate binding protein [Burkholderiales bacterium]